MIDKGAYIKAKGRICPFCGREPTEGGFIEIEAGEAFQIMNCSICQNKWQDVYRLVDVVPL